MQNTDNSLAIGTVLEHYQIGQVLSAGGFSIVYLAQDLDSPQVVAIKEFLPNKVAHRISEGRVAPITERDFGNFLEGRKHFYQEANTLATLIHPNIVHVTHFFEANDTVYMVMEYRPGCNLESYIREHKGGLSQTFIATVFLPLLNGLQLVHNNGLLHLDIKPGNIHLQAGGSPILLDFGAVQHMKMSRQFQPRTVITQGYSPIEQYAAKGYIGPWTDIYAIGATIRACIQGQSPPSAKDRYEKDTMKPAVQQFKRKYSRELLEAVDWAMEVDPELRPQTINEFLGALDCALNPPAVQGADGMFGRLVNQLPWRRSE